MAFLLLPAIQICANAYIFDATDAMLSLHLNGAGHKLSNAFRKCPVWRRIEHGCSQYLNPRVEVGPNIKIYLVFRGAKITRGFDPGSPDPHIWTMLVESLTSVGVQTCDRAWEIGDFSLAGEFILFRAGGGCGTNCNSSSSGGIQIIIWSKLHVTISCILSYDPSFLPQFTKYCRVRSIILSRNIAVDRSLIQGAGYMHLWNFECLVLSKQQQIPEMAGTKTQNKTLEALTAADSGHASFDLQALRDLAKSVACQSFLIFIIDKLHFLFKEMLRVSSAYAPPALHQDCNTVDMN
eukprot:Gb_13553 [translate_table: standard]